MLFASFAVLTCAVQNGNKSMSDDVKRDITGGLQENHGADKGVAASCRFYDFETCLGIDCSNSNVRMLA